jgi:hypothetical protein
MPDPDFRRPTGNTGTVNGVWLVGRKRDVASIYMTQHLISAYTGNMEHMAALPVRATNKIKAHILDIEDRLTHLRGYKEPDGEPITSFSFNRQFIDAAGKRTEQVLVTLPLPRHVQSGGPIAKPQ